MTDKSLFLGRVAALRDGGQLQEALTLANSFVASSPDDADAHEMLATVLAELGRNEEATDSYSAAIRCATARPREPSLTTFGDASPWYNRAAQHARAGRRDEALTDLREAVRRAPSWADIPPSDERFQGLHADRELQRIVERGRIAAREAKIRGYERALREHRAQAVELFHMSREFTSPEVTQHVRGIVLGTIDRLTAHSTGEDAARLIELAFAQLSEALTNSAPESSEKVLTQRAAHRLIHVALLYRLYDLVDRLAEGPWYD